jgi:hypothetical protein
MESVARSTLAFFSREEAEDFCQKHGWAYEVLPPKLQAEARPKRFIGYGDNYRRAATMCLGTGFTALAPRMDPRHLAALQACA